MDGRARLQPFQQPPHAFLLVNVHLLEVPGHGDRQLAGWGLRADVDACTATAGGDSDEGRETVRGGNGGKTKKHNTQRNATQHDATRRNERQGNKRQRRQNAPW